MSQNLIFCHDGIEVRQFGDRFFIRYDAGSHQIQLREDEITRDEADEAMSSSAGATRVLFGLQKRLMASGVDPYRSNFAAG
jgi:hypothetical protein